MKKRFWNWARDETNPEERTLLLEGPIAEESWYGDEVTPAAFREELFSADGPIVISVNSPGGDTIAASQIYTMLREYPGNVTVKITGIAASAASVIAMAGTKVCMSPTAMMMIHNPLLRRGLQVGKVGWHLPLCLAVQGQSQARHGKLCHQGRHERHPPDRRNRMDGH